MTGIDLDKLHARLVRALAGRPDAEAPNIVERETRRLVDVFRRRGEILILTGPDEPEAMADAIDALNRDCNQAIAVVTEEARVAVLPRDED